MIKKIIHNIHISQNLDDSFGGPPKSVPYLCNSLNNLGVDTQLVSVKLIENESNSIVNKFNLKWNSFNYKYIKKLRYSPEIERYLKLQIKENTIFHVHNPWNYVPYIVYKTCKKYRIPFIQSARGSFYKWSLEQSKLQKFISWNLLQKDMLNKAACIHATEINEAKALRDLGIKTQIAVIPNGVDLSEFENLDSQEVSKNNLNLNISKKYILFISRVHPKKGLEYLVKSFIKYSKQFENYELLIIGPTDDEKYKKSLDSVISDSKLVKKIHFLGMLKGKNRIDVYNASSLFVLPSHTENFGMVIAEAMAAKIPVITTFGTPWQEIEKYNAGWWVELSQENIDNALYEALSLKEKDLERRGLNGFELIKKYEWKHQAKKMKELYEYILGDRDKPEFVYEYEDKI